MPILKPEPCIWPENLLDLANSEDADGLDSRSSSPELPSTVPPPQFSEPAIPASLSGSGPGTEYSASEIDGDENASKWWAVYTKPRFEKKLMRQLFESQVPFYGPMISRRFRSPNGKLRLSVEPLFPNYVFIHGTEMQRYTAVCTGSVSRWMPVLNPLELVTDLRQIHNLILTDAPLAPELRLQPGQRVRVRSGVFKGFEGVIIRRENQVRLLIAVRYMGRGASVALDDCQLEAI
ncbi:MAG: antitermination protein NusG [Pirellula sp.]|nr:antitermination protein NusG [Pirellula sp.]